MKRETSEPSCRRETPSTNEGDGETAEGEGVGETADGDGSGIAGVLDADGFASSGPLSSTCSSASKRSVAARAPPPPMRTNFHTFHLTICGPRNGTANTMPSAKAPTRRAVVTSETGRAAMSQTADTKPTRPAITPNTTVITPITESRFVDMQVANQTSLRHQVRAGGPVKEVATRTRHSSRRARRFWLFEEMRERVRTHLKPCCDDESCSFSNSGRPA